MTRAVSFVSALLAIASRAKRQSRPKVRVLVEGAGFSLEFGSAQ